MRAEFRQACVGVLCLAAGFLTACSHPQQTLAPSWDPGAAAAYLDQREVTWRGWPGSARDHETFCISCHTVLPYALSRPTLRRALAEQGPSDDERQVLENVTKRVRLWNQVGPYYTDEGYGNGKPAESRGTEVVLNALILASNNAQNGELNDVTRAALNNMWALQLTEGDGKGAWPWLRFGMEPWEADDSQYYGAVLAAIAAGTAPEDYHSSGAVQPRLTLLKSYLRSKSEQQSMMNRVALLWASTKLPGLLESDAQQRIIREILNEQQSDGGWSLSSNVWPSGWSLHSITRRRLRSDWTRQSSESDGYATGFITFVLQEAGVPPQNPKLKQGLLWLASNQNRDDGSWPSISLSQRRSSSSNVGHFMRDAATAYAVLALSENGAVSVVGSGAGKLSTLNPTPAASARIAAVPRGN